MAIAVRRSVVFPIVLMLAGLVAVPCGAAPARGAAPAAPPAGADTAGDHIYVALDKAKLVKLPPHVDTVIVGNPAIADVTLLKHNGLVILTGKGYGETNVIFLDAAGQALSEATVTVQTGQNLLTVQRGLDRESYSCAPRCEPAVSLGDATKFLTDTSGQISSRNTLVGSGQH